MSKNTYGPRKFLSPLFSRGVFALFHVPVVLWSVDVDKEPDAS